MAATHRPRFHRLPRTSTRRSSQAWCSTKGREGGTMRQSHRIPAGAGMARNMLFLALGALLPAGVAHAARLEYDIGMRYMHSDNISLLSEGELSENILSPQVRFDFSHETSSVNAAIHGEVQHLKYLDGVYEDDTRGMVMGNVEWTILPDRLS